MRFMQTESVLQTKNRSGPAKNRFSVALPYMLISIKIKNSHAIYNDHSNNTANQPTV